MWQFQVFDDQSEAISNGILGSMAFLRRDEHMKAVVDPILTKNGLENLKMDEWVPFQSWLNVFKEISAEGKRQMFDLVAIGMAIGMGISLPPEIDNIPAVLASLDPVYQMHHRGADVGHYYLEQLDEQKYKVVANIPYPEDLVYGTIYGFCKRFVNDGDGLIVVIDKNAPSLKKGDKSTTYLISW